MKHALEVSQGMYQPEIKGALSGTASQKYSVEQFNKAARVNTRFTTPFFVAYDSLLGTPSAVSVCAADGERGRTDDSAASKGADSAGSQHECHAEKTSKETDLTAFRTQCELHCRRELEARLVTLVADGTHVEIKATVTNTRLYQNMTASAPCMAFYGVKNAKLCNIFEGDGTMFRTPCF